MPRACSFFQPQSPPVDAIHTKGDGPKGQMTRKIRGTVFFFLMFPLLLLLILLLLLLHCILVFCLS